MISKEEVKYDGTTHMTGRLQCMSIGCFVKTGREEEEESRSMLRRTLNV